MIERNQTLCDLRRVRNFVVVCSCRLMSVYILRK